MQLKAINQTPFGTRKFGDIVPNALDTARMSKKVEHAITDGINHSVDAIDDFVNSTLAGRSNGAYKELNFDRDI